MRRQCSDYFIIILALCMLTAWQKAANAEEPKLTSINILPLPAPWQGGIPSTTAKSGVTTLPPEVKLLNLKERLLQLKGAPGEAKGGSTLEQTGSAEPARKISSPSGDRSATIRARKGTPPALLPKLRSSMASWEGSPLQSPLPPQEELEVKMRWIGTPRQLRVKAGTGSPQKSMQERLLSPAATKGERDEQTVRAFLRSHRSHLRIDDPDRELALSRQESDSLNRGHYRFNQMYAGVRVWPAEVIVHLDPDGVVDLVDGAFIPTPRKLTIKPALPPQQAVTTARARVAGGDGAQIGDPELVIYAPLATGARLAWKVFLDISPFSQWLVMVDALNGETLVSYNTVQEENVPGSGRDLLGVSRSINVWHAGNSYYLVDTSKPMYDATSTPPQPVTTRGGITIMDAGNQVLSGTSSPISFITSTSSSSGWLPDGVSAAYNISKAYDYYRSRHGRNSIDGKGGSITATVRLNKGYQNAFWSPSAGAMFFGDAKPYAGALDVVAHELTHGVTTYTANLEYLNQSGALNEAFSDIMGQSVESYVTGTTDWVHGEDLGAPDRNLKDPSSIRIPLSNGSSLPYPSKMSDYVQGSVLDNFPNRDNGGVHINSSIINHAYYMLAEGVSGAIGMSDAERIFYRALTTHLTTQSDFIDARLACIQSAQEIFGESSTQAAKTAEAFSAVEIVDAAPTPVPDPGPPASAPDSALFVSYDPGVQDFRLARREGALNDGNLGSWLSRSAITPSRPSVTADGTLAAYVKADHDLCLIETNAPASEACLGLPGVVHSASMSPDGEIFGFVLLNEDGTPDNKIVVVNLGTDQSQTYPLVGNGTDGVTLDSIDHADSMTLTARGRFVIYDALNVLRLADGSKVGAWSIYALDLERGETFSLVPPAQNYDTVFPALGHTSDNFIAFERFNQLTGEDFIFAGDLRQNKAFAVGKITNDFGVPGYTGDDTAITYSVPDSSQWSGYNIQRQALTTDRTAPSGSAAIWLQDAYFGVIYRRGAYNKLAVSNSDTSSGVVTSSVGDINCGVDCSFVYPTGTAVTLTAKTYAGARFAGWGGACSGTGSCSVTLNQDLAVTATFTSPTDTIAPQITSFSIPASATSATVPISSFSATDNVAVTGYCVSEQNTPADCAWSGTPPTSHTFTGATPGTPATRTLYPYARDAAGNVIAGPSVQTTITLQTALNGSCGSANGGTFSAAPDASLCSAGTASPVSGSGPWTWSCSGANGGSSASCAASYGAPTDCGLPHWQEPRASQLAAHLAGELLINGKRANICDEVAIFDASGNLVGVSHARSDGKYGDLALFGDSPLTQEDEGAGEGEALTVRVWDGAAKREYTSVSLLPLEQFMNYLPYRPPLTFANGSWTHMKIVVEQGEGVELKSGWNFLGWGTSQGYYTGAAPQPGEYASGATMTVAASLSSAFESIGLASTDSFVVVGPGAVVYVPGSPFNTLKELLPGKAYWIYLRGDKRITLPGTPLQPAQQLTLASGWTQVGYWGNDGSPPAAGFGCLGTLFNVAVNEEGSVFVPGSPFNTLNSLQKNKGYFIHTTAPATLKYLCQ